MTAVTVGVLFAAALAAGCERETFTNYTEGVWARSPQPPEEINNSVCKPEARAAGAHWLMFLIDVRANGSVASAEVEGVNDDHMRKVDITPVVSACAASVQATVKATKFRPAETKDGRPVAARLRLGVGFTHGY
jgi:hypothetical protein